MSEPIQEEVSAVVAAEEEEKPLWKTLLGVFVKQMIMLAMLTTIMKNFYPGNQVQVGNDGKTMADVMANNLFSQNHLYDVYFYIDEIEKPFNGYEDTSKLIWALKSLTYGDWTGGPFEDGSYSFESKFPTPSALLKNQSLFLHVFATEAGSAINPDNRTYNPEKVMHEVHRLNKYKRKYYKKTANLLTGKSEKSEEELKKADEMSYEVLNFWHPNISINIVTDFTPWRQGAIPAPIDEGFRFVQNGKAYKPVLFFNDYWNLGSDYMPINDTVEELHLNMMFYPISLFKYQLYASQKTQSKWEQMMPGTEDVDDGKDSMKQALLETNPIILGVTAIVSLLHAVFEFLAFKSDIQFWKERKDLAGISVRSVLFNIIQSAIVFLYICDNETNFMVKCSVGVSLLIECWKIPRVLNVEVDRDDKWMGLIPKMRFSDKGSYVESDTRVYDEMAFKYLRWLLFPLLIGYAGYSIIYVEQKGWYSWILNMLYGYLLTFGFITMTPQLFINYKLKSVAHLPWKMLSYKFINTFIDDLFAFVIKMPLLYRIGCFRDDIIFVIYVYQRWIYPVDPTRFNEFGTSGEKNEEVEESKKTK